MERTKELDYILLILSLRVHVAHLHECDRDIQKGWTWTTIDEILDRKRGHKKKILNILKTLNRHTWI